MNTSFLFSGILAVMVIGSLCFIAIYQVVTKQAVQIPPFVEGVAGVIIGYFFSHQGAQTVASGIVNGINAAQSAGAVPGQTTTTTNPPAAPQGPGV
jgi:hypothetical protein